VSRTKSELLARVPPVYRFARAYRERRRARGNGGDAVKRALLRDTARAHGLRVLVETGTYMGETAWALRHAFDRIETIELEPTLARLAEIRFARTAHVTVHRGDSATVLPRVLTDLDRPALFWLDAHPSTDRTAHDAPVPLRDELAAIAAHSVAGHVVLVDDLAYMGTPGYPALAELELPGYELEPCGSVARLTPVTRS
jgi:predicted O-methyltransferase YrrM